MYLFDDYGWYSGSGTGKRSTTVEPANKSETETPGELRSNWTGREWFNVPYVAPDFVGDAKRRARDILERLYQEKLSLGEIGGMNLDAILPQIFKADAVISAGANNFAVVSNGDSQLLNATKLTTIKTYWNDCSNAAETHFTNIQGLTTVNDVKNYVKNTLETLWPSAEL